MPGDINRQQLDILVENKFKNQIKLSKSYLGPDIGRSYNQVIIKSVIKIKKLKNSNNTGRK